MQTKQHSGWNRGALWWGFAEATLFFIVPDVLLSYLARKDLKVGLIACLFALVGAISGGLMMYYWGYENEAAAIAGVVKVPAIDMAMVESASGHIEEEGALALFRGAFGGVPYKVYAVQSFGSTIGLIPFVIISILSRLCRFVAVTCLFHFGLKVLRRVGVNTDARILLAVVWIAFYSFYFAVI